MLDHPYDPATWLPHAALALDLLKSIAWPIAIVIAACMFRGEIGKLLPRLHKLGREGIEFRPDQDDAALTEPEGGRLPKASDLPLDDPMAQEIEDENRQDLERFKDEDRVAVLLRALTFQQMNKVFAIIYANIFGSQIETLRLLNGRPVPVVEAAQMFSNLQAARPQFADWDLAAYLGYLKLHKLIFEERGTLFITETGRNFLRFLVDHRLREDRPN